MLWTWSQERDRNISKTFVFVFHRRVQHDEASGYVFYNTKYHIVSFSRAGKLDFKVGGGMEHWKVLSATMVGRQEKLSNSRHSRMAKTTPWW